jgi:hypothetical protein
MVFLRYAHPSFSFVSFVVKTFLFVTMRWHALLL